MPAGQPALAASRSGRHRAGVQLMIFTVLLAAGLAGLGAAAVGIAHQLLPRRFTPAQQSRIATWEMERRWRAFPAGAIFPDSVKYVVSGAALNSSGDLALQARRLAIAPQSGCAAVVSGAAARVLHRYGCTGAVRATYVDASGSMVATVAVIVMPGTAAAETAASDLTHGSGNPALLVQAFRVLGSPAAGFGDPQRQLTRTVTAGPYLILVTAGFADGRHRIGIRGDYYQYQEMTSLNAGLTAFAATTLGRPLPVPACPGAPGC